MHSLFANETIKALPDREFLCPWRDFWLIRRHVWRIIPVVVGESIGADDW